MSVCTNKWVIVKTNGDMENEEKEQEENEYPSAGIGRDDIHVTPNEGDYFGRVGARVAYDQMSTAGSVVDLFDNQGSTIFSAVWIENSTDVSANQILLRNEVWWVVLDVLGLADEIGE